MEITTYDHQTGLAEKYEVQPRTQNSHLVRVTGKLSEAIQAFFKANGVGNSFHAEDLRTFIFHAGIVCAPNSPCRVMQILKKQGLLNYRVVSRAKSLYEII